MHDEIPFRIALAVILLFTASVALHYRLKSAASGERISHRDEGYVFAAGLRLAGLCLWGSTLFYLIVPTWIQWASFPLPDWVRWCGAVTGLISAWLMYWTLSSLGTNLTDTVVVKGDATLVTQGPYRWVRHPYYVTAALIMGSTTLLTANYLIGVSSVLVLGLLAVRTPKEEQRLIDRFGDDYRDYMAQTGRFLPKIGR